jgi:hypothetical protein
MMRKQVYELTLADLRRVPVWEFALDEEGVEGQDEATVRPHEFEAKVDPSAGMLIVRAKFHLADGSESLGYVTPSLDPDAGLGTHQPVIVAEGGQVRFWFGAWMPDRAAMDASYLLLGKPDPSVVFPVRFDSDVPLECGHSSGEIDGFLFLEDLISRRTRVLR